MGEYTNNTYAWALIRTHALMIFGHVTIPSLPYMLTIIKYVHVG